MKNKAFLLGFLTIGSQTLLIRAVVSSFGGNELLIGLAFFGWMTAVALGAWLGGLPKRAPKVEILFVLGAILLPVMIIAAWLAPLLLVDSAMEMAGFIPAGALAILVMIPLGLISGGLFAGIARGGWQPSRAVSVTYLWEGLGAFLGGLTVTLLTGSVFSTMSAALMLMVVTIAWVAACCRERSPATLTAIAVIAIACLWGSHPVGDRLALKLDQVKFHPFQVKNSFDTPYTHQTLLAREGSVLLMTDNRIEATYPDPATAEEWLLPVLLHDPTATAILSFGRSEFSLVALARELPGIEITSVDPRNAISRATEQLVPFHGEVLRIDDDPMAFLARGEAPHAFDAVLVDAHDADSYHGTRQLTDSFFDLIKHTLKYGGSVMISTPYDTDRYLSEESRAALELISGTLATRFRKVWMWPGTQTLLFASDSIAGTPPLDTLHQRLAALPYEPHHLRADHLTARLDDFRMARVNSILEAEPIVNTLEKPRMLHRHLAWRSRMTAEGDLLSSWLSNPWWLVLPGAVLLLFMLGPQVTAKARRKAIGRMLLFLAGFCSLALELVSFYLFQATAGSLYSDLGLMIGVFMVGLAAGSALALRMEGRGMASAGLALCLAATVGLLVTWDMIGYHLVLWYYLAFLFTVAVATGSLFVSGSYFLMGASFNVNSGSGYAIELSGSALAALLVLTLLLPQFSLSAVLTGLSIVMIIALSIAWRQDLRR